MNLETRILISQGFDAGNYASAYISQDYQTAFDRGTGKKEHEAYCVAYILGFFSSYELHEIPFEYQDLYKSAYFSEYGKEVIKAGYIDPHSDSDWEF